MRIINLICLLPVLLMTMTGCQPAVLSGEKPGDKLTAKTLVPDAYPKLAWLNQADSAKDAKAAISQKDYRLLAINLRGAVFPGVDPGQLATVKQRCKHRFLDGMGDVIIDKAHREWWQKGRDYAEAYNRILVAYCLRE